MDEQDIINAAYTLLEQDNTMWDTTDDEYLTAREFLNMGVGRWEIYEATTWRELQVMNSDASSSLGGNTTTSASVSDYACPSDMAIPGGWVTTSTSAATSPHVFWEVIPVERRQELADSDEDFCWFTGNRESGYTLHFNPRITQVDGSTIDYPYYKKATKTSATSDTVEMSDPYYLSYFIAAHMGEEGINTDFFNMAEEKLENMRVKNMAGFWGVPNPIVDYTDGFGY